jgi:ribulose-5-phosphate 4-epimerase/fuculose-1-phosphate aldolase
VSAPTLDPRVTERRNPRTADIDLASPLAIVDVMNGEDRAVADAVAARIEAAAASGVPIRAVMLERLGPNVWHRTPAEASAVLEELEETARLWLRTGRSVLPLTAGQIDELRTTFKARW